jgi:hypothetical protein
VVCQGSLGCHLGWCDCLRQCKAGGLMMLCANKPNE